MSDDTGASETNSEQPPPQAVLYGFYALIFVLLIAVLVIVGVYGA